MTKTEELQKKLKDLWTMQDLERKFKRSPMTVYSWARRGDLPVVVIPGTARPTLRFVPEDVKKWAKKNGVKLAA